MENQIERVDARRIPYLKWYITGFVIFILLMLIRHFLRMSGAHKELIGQLVLVGLVISLLLQVVFITLSFLLGREIQSNPDLKVALGNELVRAISMESWIAAYIGAAGMTVFFAATWFIYPLCDPVTISICSIAMGAGCHRIYFYFRYQNS